MGEKSASKKEKSIKRKKKSKRKKDEGLDQDERKLKKKLKDSKLKTKKMKAGKDHKKKKDKEHDKTKKRKDHTKKKDNKHDKNEKQKRERNASESKSHKIKKSHKKKPTLSRSAAITTKSMMGEDCLHVWPTVRQHVLSYNIDCFSNINNRMLLKGNVTKMESRIGLLMDQHNTCNDIYLSSSDDENCTDEVTFNKNSSSMKSSCGVKVVPIRTVVTNIQHNLVPSR